MGIQLDTVRTFRWKKDSRNATRVDCHGHQEAIGVGRGNTRRSLRHPKSGRYPASQIVEEVRTPAVFTMTCHERWESACEQGQRCTICLDGVKHEKGDKREAERGDILW